MDVGLGGYWKDKVSVNDGHDCLGDDGRELVYGVGHGGGGVLTSVRSVKGLRSCSDLSLGLRSPHIRLHIRLRMHQRHIPRKRRTHGC